MGKVEILFYHWGYFVFLQKCLFSSPPCFIGLFFSKSLNLIGCQGDLKGNFSKKKLKNHLLRNHKGNEAGTWHICLGHKPLHSLCVFLSMSNCFRCYGNLKFP